MFKIHTQCEKREWIEINEFPSYEKAKENAMNEADEEQVDNKKNIIYIVNECDPEVTTKKNI